MNPRVCVVGPGFRFLGGVSVYTCTLVRALREDLPVSALLIRRLLPRRLYPGAARVGDQLTSLDYAGVPHFDGIDWWWGRSLVQALGFLRRQRPEVLVLQWWTAAVGHTYLLLALLARLRRVPVLIEVHEVQDPGEAGKAGLLSRYGQLVLRGLLRLASGVLLHHDRDREALEDAGLDLSGTRTAVAPHGPYDHLAAVVPQAPPEFAGDPLSAQVADGTCRDVLSFGLIRPYKGLEDLVAAFGGLPRPVAERLVLTIVGETWEGWDEPLRRLRDSPHRDRVRVVNRYVSDAEAAFVFAEADVLVLPYRRASSSGPLHIAMAQGLAVVVYDVPALRAVVDGYEGVQVVPGGEVAALGAALERVAGQPRRRFEPAGDWRRTVEAYRELLA